MFYMVGNKIKHSWMHEINSLYFDSAGEEWPFGIL